MEVDGVTPVLAGEAGRSLGEVNTAAVKTIGPQDEAQTGHFLEKGSQIRVGSSLSNILLR